MADSEQRDVLSRAKEALEAGRPWEARDRLAGRLAHAPADQSVLRLLARAWYELGDEARAGRYWYLTADASADAEAARDAFKHAHPDPVEMAWALNVRAPIEAWPESVQARLRGLATRVDEDEHRRHPAGRPLVAESAPPGKLSGVGNTLLVAVAFALTLGVWVVGIVALVRIVLL